MASAVDEAIAAVERPEPEQRTTIQVRVRSGRVVALNVPVDLSPIDTVDLIGYISTALPPELAKVRQPSRLVVARGQIPRA